MEENRIVSSQTETKEKNQEYRLRPKNFREFIGQKKVIQNIELMVQSAKKRKQAMDHILFSGPPGLGKTSLSTLVATELESHLHMISGPAIERKGDLAAILTNLKQGDVLFIDEIHRIHISIEEILYSAMEDFRLDIVIGQGVSARTMQIDLAPFTLIGATTRSGLLSNPLRDRFIGHLTFELYTTDELSKIVSNNAKKLGLKVEAEAIARIASRSRGTPRIANRILRRVRDYSIVKNVEIVSQKEVEKALDLMDIDQCGLDTMDRKILHVMSEYYSGGPVGIEALSSTLGQDRGTIEDVYEPYLLQEGFIIRTPRGRQLSEKALLHLNG